MGTTKQATLNLFSHLLYSYGTIVSVESSLLTCTNTWLYGKTTKGKVVCSSTNLPTNPSPCTCPFYSLLHFFHRSWWEPGQGDKMPLSTRAQRPARTASHRRTSLPVHKTHVEECMMSLTKFWAGRVRINWN